MPDALGFDSQRELIEYSLGATNVEGHYLEFGVFTGGTIRFMAKRIGGRVIFMALTASRVCRRLGRDSVSEAAHSTLRDDCRVYRAMCVCTAGGSTNHSPSGFPPIPGLSPSFISIAIFTVRRKLSCRCWRNG